MDTNQASTQSGTVESPSISDAEFEQFLALLNTRDQADENSEGKGEELFTQSDADIGGTNVADLHDFVTNVTDH